MGEFHRVQPWARQWLEVVNYDPLHGLQQMRRSEEVVLYRVTVFGAGISQEVFHRAGTLSRLSLRLKMCRTSTVIEQSGADAIWICGFSCLDPPEFLPHLVSWLGETEGGSGRWPLVRESGRRVHKLLRYGVEWRFVRRVYLMSQDALGQRVCSRQRGYDWDTDCSLLWWVAEGVGPEWNLLKKKVFMSSLRKLKHCNC